MARRELRPKFRLEASRLYAHATLRTASARTLRTLRFILTVLAPQCHDDFNEAARACSPRIPPSPPCRSTDDTADSEAGVTQCQRRSLNSTTISILQLIMSIHPSPSMGYTRQVRPHLCTGRGRRLPIISAKMTSGTLTPPTISHQLSSRPVPTLNDVECDGLLGGLWQ